MPKIDIEVTIKNSEITDSYKVKAIINDSVIKYKEPDDTTVLFDYKENILTRENDQMKMIYNFNSKEDSIILVKDYNRHINLVIETIKLKKKDNNLEIEFKIDNEKFTYRIEELKWV